MTDAPESLPSHPTNYAPLPHQADGRCAGVSVEGVTAFATPLPIGAPGNYLDGRIGQPVFTSAGAVPEGYYSATPWNPIVLGIFKEKDWGW